MDSINGDYYLRTSERNSNKSVVYFTSDLSDEGLRCAYNMVKSRITGKVAVKLHTGEKNGPNIIPVDWIKKILPDIPNSTIVETNSYYEGDRYTTKLHRDTLKVNGWTFSDVDILDEEGVAYLPVTGGKWFSYMSVGKNLTNYDSLVVLTHFKGHKMAGFGGSNKNIGIGCADGRIGKKMIHTQEGSRSQWSILEEEFMERICESTKSVVDYFYPRITYVNVMRNMSVSCDCEGTAAEPVVTPNIGILASTDILALDQACVDIVYSLKPDDRKALVERIESRKGLRQLTYMHELGMGNSKYILINIDQGESVTTPREVAKLAVPFKK